MIVINPTYHFKMKIDGDIDNINEFIKILKNIRNKNEKHFYNVIKVGKLSNKHVIKGYLRKTVYTSMFDGWSSSYDSDKKKKPYTKGTNIKTESARLNLRIEIVAQSTEKKKQPFTERYIIDRGILMTTEEYRLKY